MTLIFIGIIAVLGVMLARLHLRVSYLEEMVIERLSVRVAQISATLDTMAESPADLRKHAEALIIWRQNSPWRKSPLNPANLQSRKREPLS